MTKASRQTGFTIIELMITLVVAGVLVAWAVPNMKNFVLGGRLTAQTNTLVAALQYARSEAVKRSSTVTIGPIGSTNPTTDWGTNGWRVFIDTDGDGVLDSDEVTIRQEAALPSGTDYATVNVSTTPLKFNRDGSASAALTATICNTAYKSTKNARTISVSAVGTIQTTESTCP
ncbi:MAG: GspH/FimT family pseudopilin [Gammaproteobacteria bacterium]